MLSFKAKSDTSATLTYTVGDQTGEVVLTPDAKRHVVKLVVTATDKTFSLACNDCSLWEVQLERGTMASSWGQSFLDNSSDRAYWQAQKYLNGALKDASTTFNGGLGLTNMILFGNYDKETKAMKEVTAGVSGNREDDNDVAFWAGGDYESAVKTSMDYLVNHKKGEWQPTDAELANMANFILTHGGTAILNDMILRGYVYALGGRIGNIILGTNGLEIDDSTIDGYMKLDDYGLRGDGFESAFHIGHCGNETAMLQHGKGSILNCSITKSALRLEGYEDAFALHLGHGLVAGLRPNIREITATEELPLTTNDHTLIVNNSAKITLTLPSSAEKGQVYRLIHITQNTVNLSHPDTQIVINPSDGVIESFSEMTTLTLTFFGTIWYAEFK